MSGSAGRSRIYLSPPHMTGNEESLIAEVFRSGWIAPLGPHVDAFQAEFQKVTGAKKALALVSGTSALHLALQLVGVAPGDEVFVSTLTFAATVYPIRYLGARPVFIDSSFDSWNMDPSLLDAALERRARQGVLPRAVVVVHLYGQSADLKRIRASCDRYEIPLVEDAAEALGATYTGIPNQVLAPGTVGKAGVYSFNGNKIITTSGGGMLVSDDDALIAHALKLATQARDPAPHYEHSEIGYNYRMSNVLAAVGRAQLMSLSDRVAARRRNFAAYVESLSDLPGIEFMPEAPWGVHTRWLTTLTVDPAEFGCDREAIRLALESEDIEARPVWKPMHVQPVFSAFETVGGSVSETIFRDGLCLPSGSDLTSSQLERVARVIRRTHVTSLGRPLASRA